jgi:hypothetical protein
MAATLPAGTLCTVSDHNGSDQHDTAHSDESVTQGDDGPVTLRAAVLVLWIEAAALGALTFVEVFKLVTGHPEKPGLAAVLVAMIGAAALLLAQLGRALVRRRLWARSPAIVLQLLAVPVAFYMITGESTILTRIGGVVIAVVTLLGAGLLLAPASRNALTFR